MPAERDAEIDRFLRRAGWHHADRERLAGDASGRRYLRLTRPTGGDSAVLMEAPRADAAQTAAFVDIARHLAGIGLSPPRIYRAEPDRGLILLEDLGDGLFSRVAAARPRLESELYLAAADLLIDLQEAPLPEGIPHASPREMARMTRLTWEWYPGADPSHLPAVLDRLEALLDSIAPERPVLVLRDYHAENLIWLPGRAGVRRVGLLDFQDAFGGHPAYDLVSLLRDARRDVPASLAARVSRHFLSRSGACAADFGRAAAILAVQRNLRILGIFCRLARRDNKPAYVSLIPRVWRHLEQDLTHAGLAGLRRQIHAALPAPATGLLETLRQPCRTVPPVS